MRGVPLQRGKIVEGVGTVELAGVDQAHEKIPDLRTVEGAVKQRIFAMQHGPLEHLFAEIIIQWGARLAQKYR